MFFGDRKDDRLAPIGRTADASWAGVAVFENPAEFAQIARLRSGTVNLLSRTVGSTISGSRSANSASSSARVASSNASQSISLRDTAKPSVAAVRAVIAR
jgi:hypothetical protein